LDARWRNWYLGALGVIRYVARDSVDEVVEEPVETRSERQPPAVETRASALVRDIAASVASDRPVVGSAPVSMGDNQGRLVAPVESGKPMLKKESQQAAPTRPHQPPAATDDSEPVQFRLAFWQPANDLVVLSSMPPTIRPAEPQQEMLANLLKAIGRLPGRLHPQLEGV